VSHGAFVRRLGHTGALCRGEPLVVVNASSTATISLIRFCRALTDGSEVAIEDRKQYPDGWAYLLFRNKFGEPHSQVRTAVRTCER